MGLIIVMVGCNNPLKKSISEELTMEEIKSISKKDPAFLTFYDLCFENKCYEHFLKEKTFQVLYSDLTYKRFYEYVKQTSDKNYINSAYEEAEKEWEERYGYTEQKFDSIINYWQNYVDENAIETYLDIDFDHATPYKGYYDKGVRIYFKLIPRREKLHSVWFGYTIKTKDDTHKIVISETAHHIYSFSEPIVIDDYIMVYSKNGFYEDVAVNKLSSEELKDKYEFVYSIKDIETDKDGFINEYSLYKEVPFEVGQYIKEPSSTRKESVIGKYIDDSFVSLEFYKKDYLKLRMEREDPMCYNFFQYIVDCKKAL